MAGSAGTVVNLFTPGIQLIEGECLGGQLTDGGSSSLFLLQPGAVVFFGTGINHDRHEAVVTAAEFGTLAAINTRLVDNGPGLFDKTGDGILLDAQRGHPPGVNHVIGSNQEANLFID